MRTKAQSQKTEFLRLDFLRAEVAPLLISDIFRAIFLIDSNVEYCALLVQAWTEYGFRLTRKVSAWGESLREFCEENGRRELLRQWATEKNGGKTPDGVFCGSSAMTWWRCDKGHSFSMRAAFHTTHEQRCPYCTRCKVLMGDNDLATVAPDVAAE